MSRHGHPRPAGNCSMRPSLENILSTLTYPSVPSADSKHSITEIDRAGVLSQS